MALSLVPLTSLDDGWDFLLEQSPGSTHPAHAALREFSDYFESTWLENQAVHPREIWNHHK